MNANFVQLDNDLVINVILIPEEQAYRGAEYLNLDLGLKGDWVQFDPQLPGVIPPCIGGLYNKNLDRFSLPRPYPSWTYSWDEEKWNPPTPQPDDMHEWDEDTQSWVIAI